MSEPIIPGGSIIVARKIVESEIWKKPSLYIKVWLYLLIHAQHKPYKNLRRGQLRTSIPEIIEACSHYVGARIERPTKDQIIILLSGYENPMKGVAKATMISTTKATQGYLITIDNYDLYQSLSNYESNAHLGDENSTEGKRKQQQDDNINKNVKNEKNEKNDSKITYIEFPVDDHVFNNLYNKGFKGKFNRDHMDVTEDQRETIFSNMDLLESFDITEERFEEAVEDHFENLSLKNDGNILAFIPAFHRHFEVMHLGQDYNWRKRQSEETRLHQQRVVEAKSK